MTFTCTAFWKVGVFGNMVKFYFPFFFFLSSTVKKLNRNFLSNCNAPLAPDYFAIDESGQDSDMAVISGCCQNLTQDLTLHCKLDHGSEKFQANH